MNSQFLGEVCFLSYSTLLIAASKLFFLDSMEKSSPVFPNFHLLYPTSVIPSICLEGINPQVSEFFKTYVNYIYTLIDILYR